MLLAYIQKTLIMITSIILRAVLVLNSLVILLNVFTDFINGINFYMLLGLQLIFVLGYFINKIVTQIIKTVDYELNDVDIYIIKKNQRAVRN